MVLLALVPVVNANHDVGSLSWAGSLAGNERANNSWFPEAFYWLSFPVQMQHLSYVDVIDVLPLGRENPHVESSIILVTNGKCLSIVTLLNQLSLDVDTIDFG